MSTAASRSSAGASGATSAELPASPPSQHRWLVLPSAMMAAHRFVSLFRTRLTVRTRYLNARSVTIFLTSHCLADVLLTCGHQLNDESVFLSAYAPMVPSVLLE